MPASSHPLSSDQLMAYLDGELPSQRMMVAADHLAHCRECQMAAADFQRLSRELMEWAINLPSPESILLPELTRDEVAPVNMFTTMGRLCKANRRPAIVILAVSLLLLLGLDLQRTLSPYTPPPDFSLLRQGVVAENAQDAQSRIQSPLRTAASPRSNSSYKTEVSALAGVPRIARTAQLQMTVRDFTPVRESVMRLVTVEKGFISQLQISQPPASGRSLVATIQVPAQRLDAALQAMKQLGRFRSESQSGEDVSKQAVDVDARLANLRVEEARLNQILKEHAGRLSDVLEVEERISSVRGEIETTRAEEENLSARVQFASLELTVTEEYKNTLVGNEGSTSTKFHKAAIDGIEHLQNFSIAVLITGLAYGPSVLATALILFLFYQLTVRYRRLR